MKPRIYTDTSVLGGYYDPEFAEWSKLLINDYIEGHKIIVLSDLTLQEMESAPRKVQEIIDKIAKSNVEYIILEHDAQELAQKYIDENAITPNYLIDAQHIALATIHKVDVLVSWNFRHIVNYQKIRLYNAVNLRYGYSLIEIRSPREIL